MRVLVTGANGFIGSSLMSYLGQRGYELVGCTHHLSGREDGTFICCDLAKEFNVDVQIDAIVHTAARNPAIGNTFRNYFEDNIMATSNVMTWAESHDVKKIIYLATVSSYGNVDGKLHEDSPHNNPDDYGLSKYICEKIIRSSSIPNRILVLPGVIGKNGNECWIRNIAEKLICNQEVHCYNPDGLFNNIVAVEDLCSYIEKLLRRDFKDSQTYIAAVSETVTVREVISYLVEELRSESKVTFEENGKNMFYLDSKRIFDDGFESQSIREILRIVSDEVKRRLSLSDAEE